MSTLSITKKNHQNEKEVHALLRKCGPIAYLDDKCASLNELIVSLQEHNSSNIGLC
jgi:hypothetical protein